MSRHSSPSARRFQLTLVLALVVVACSPSLPDEAPDAATGTPCSSSDACPALSCVCNDGQSYDGRLCLSGVCSDAASVCPSVCSDKGGYTASDAGTCEAPVLPTGDLLYPIVAASGDGAVYVAGHHGGPTVFGRGQKGELKLEQPNHGLYLARFDEGRQITWAYGFNNSSSDVYLRDVAAAADGTVVVVGDFTGVLTIGTYKLSGTQSLHDRFGFAAAWNASGTLAWVLQYGGDDRNKSGIESVAAVNGGFVLGGRFGLWPDYFQHDPGSNSRLTVIRNGGAQQTLATQTLPMAENFVQKIDRDGNNVWLTRINSPTVDKEGSQVYIGLYDDHTPRVATRQGGVVVAVEADVSLYAGGKLAFGPDLTDLPYSTVGTRVLAGLDESGMLTWSKRLVPAPVAPGMDIVAHHTLQDLAPAKDGGFLLTGFEGQFHPSPQQDVYDFGNGVQLKTPNAKVIQFAYLARFSADGTAVWARGLSAGSDINGEGGSGGVTAAGAISFPTSGFALAGRFSGKLAAGSAAPVTTSAGGAFVATFDDSGAFRALLTGGKGSFEDDCTGVDVSPAGTGYITGNSDTLSPVSLTFGPLSGRGMAYLAPFDATGFGAGAGCGCTPRKCVPGLCGHLPDGCGGFAECGGCAAGETCDAANTCVPMGGTCPGSPCMGLTWCDRSTGICRAGCEPPPVTDAGVQEIPSAQCGANKWCDPTHNCQCISGMHLSGNTCVCDQPGLTVCGSACVDTMSDAFNCGACGMKCPSGEACVSGKCGCPTYAPDVCGGKCVSLASDRTNCGTCGTPAPKGGSCDNGAPSCGSWLTCDSTDPADPAGMKVCTSPGDPNNCGACGNKCPPTAKCDYFYRYSCQCPDGSRDNCGVCGNKCPSGTTCINGACSCGAGMAICRNQCVSLSTNTDCGACGNACPSGASCVSGKCTCPIAGETACNGACVNLQTDRANCGACGTACPSGGSCVGGKCACAAGTAVCNGACVNLQTDQANCGTCGHACAAGLMCAGGQCVCAQGTADCSGTCTDLATNRRNCGTCGHVCGSTEDCVGGTCGPCPAASLCGGVCVDLQTDSANCGACGTMCNPSTGYVCQKGSCCYEKGTGTSYAYSGDCSGDDHFCCSGHSTKDSTNTCRCD